MQCELAQPLRGHRHHARIVRARGDLIEQHRTVGQHEQLHAEHAPSVLACRVGLADQPLDGGPRDAPGLLQHRGISGRRLPGLAVVAAFLALSDRRAGHNARGRAHGQHGQLVIQRGQRLHDHARDVALARGAAPGLRFHPRRVDAIGGSHHRLAVSGRAHHRLDHARIPYGLGAGTQLLQCAGKTVRRGRQPQLLMGDHPQPFAVHADRGDLGARHHLHPRGRGLGQLAGGDGLHLRHDDVGAHLVEQRAQLRGVGHIQHARLMRHLLGGGAGVRVGGAHPRAEPHQLDHHLLAQLAGAQEQYAGGAAAQRCAKRTVCPVPGVGNGNGGGGLVGGLVDRVVRHTHILPSSGDVAAAAARGDRMRG